MSNEEQYDKRLDKISEVDTPGEGFKLANFTEKGDEESAFDMSIRIVSEHGCEVQIVKSGNGYAIYVK